MKRIVLSLLLSAGVIGFINAQKPVTKTEITKQAKKKQELDEKAAKKKAEADAKKSKVPGTNKDGSPDMRLKSNKDAAELKKKQEKDAMEAKSKAEAENKSKKTAATPSVSNPKNSSADKVVETDAKGRTIYEGPRGGRYYLTKSGNKEYIKK